MKIEDLPNFLDTYLINHWFQPVVNLPTGDIIGYEALLRYEGKERFSPLDIFNKVQNVGLLNELDCLLIEKALSHMSSYEDTLFINIFPSTLLSQDFINTWDIFFDKRMSIVIEVCENEQISDWDSLKKVIGQLKERRVKIAIDDLGAGHSFFRQWIELEPDFIKIDQYFASNLSTNIKKQEIIKHLIMLLKGKTKLILEGIETPEDLKVALELGLDYGQGFYLGKPMPWNKRNIYKKHKELKITI